MSSVPRVSVLLPAKSCEHTVEAAVRSILGQTYEDFELVAVEDGSTDTTPDRLLELARGDRRLRVVRTGGVGLVKALNLGLALCRGELIARMDADDLALPERFHGQVRALDDDPTLAAVGAQVEVFREDRPVSPSLQRYQQWLNSLTSPERLHADRFVESPLCHPSAMLRAAALRQVGGYPDDHLAEDYALWLELLARGWRLSAVPKVLLRWRDSEDRMTRTDERYALARHLELKARYLARELRRGAGRCRLWGAGRTGLQLLRHLRAREVGVTALIDVNPRKIGQRIEGILVHPPDGLRPGDGEHLVAAVGAAGARQQIRGFLAERGFQEGTDFTCAA